MLHCIVYVPWDEKMSASLKKDQSLSTKWSCHESSSPHLKIVSKKMIKITFEVKLPEKFIFFKPTTFTLKHRSAWQENTRTDITRESPLTIPYCIFHFFERLFSSVYLALILLWPINLSLLLHLAALLRGDTTSFRALEERMREPIWQIVYTRLWSRRESTGSLITNLYEAKTYHQRSSKQSNK